MSIRFPYHQFPRLSTGRVVCKALEPLDADALFVIRSNDDINRYIGRSSNHTMADINKFIQDRIADHAAGLSVYWCIKLKTTDELIGTICYWNMDHNAETAEIGYELLPAMQGTGIMSEVIKAVVDYGFTEMKLKAITAYPRTDNARSVKLLERQGFSCSKIDEGYFVYTLKNHS